MLEDLKNKFAGQICSCLKYGLVAFTWGNVSGIDRERSLWSSSPTLVCKVFTSLLKNSINNADMSILY